MCPPPRNFQMQNWIVYKLQTDFFFVQKSAKDFDDLKCRKFLRYTVVDFSRTYCRFVFPLFQNVSLDHHHQRYYGTFSLPKISWTTACHSTQFSLSPVPKFCSSQVVLHITNTSCFDLHIFPLLSSFGSNIIFDIRFFLTLPTCPSHSILLAYSFDQSGNLQCLSYKSLSKKCIQWLSFSLSLSVSLTFSPISRFILWK